jgi:hypothetical protein
MDAHLTPRTTPGASVLATPAGWRLQVPPGEAGRYRLAQVDDSSGRRRRFLHRPPCGLRLRARLSATGLPGTWGFGFWNDPFGLALGVGGTDSRLPVLPQAAWFFHAPLPNHLALREGVPASGFFAATFRSPAVPGFLLLPGLLGLPLLALRPASRWLRRMAGRLVRQEGARLDDVEVTAWHSYSICWREQGCEFAVDEPVLSSAAPPRGPLSLVLWIDNQYAAWRPDGSLGYGTLANPGMELQLERIMLE